MVNGKAATVAALLVAEACNVGYVPLLYPGDPAPTGNRLSRVNQNSLRAETFAAANALLINAQTGIPTAVPWGREPAWLGRQAAFPRADGDD